MTDTMIQIEQMTKVFYTDEIETHALSGVHLSINRGEYVAMSGPSGCGKSTLLSIIGLLDTPTDGNYTLNGKQVANLNFADRSRIRNQEIGFIFQCFNLIGDLTVEENVELPLTYRAGMPSAERVPVKVGRASVNSIQVLGGLQEGDTVILSDMSRWDNTPTIRLN